MHAKLPILIVDKGGVIGIALAERLHENFQVVLVSGAQPSARGSVIHIPYRRKIPRIPDQAYSHMFLVYNGEDELLDMLPSFMAKSQQAHSSVLFITSFMHCSELLTKRLDNHALHAMTILVYGELFDNTGLEVNIVNDFIQQARLHQRIQIPNTGLGKHHPVSLDDALTAMIAAGFTDKRPDRVLLLFPRHSVTEMTIGRIIQKLHPLIRLDFKKQKNRSVGFSIPEGTYVFSDYNLEERLRLIDMRKDAATQAFRPKRTAPVKRKRSNIWFGLGLFVAGLTFLPLFFTLIFSVAGAGLLGASLYQTEKAHLGLAHTLASTGQGSFAAATTLQDSMVLTGIFLPEVRNTLVKDVKVGLQLAETQVNITQAMQTMQAIYQGKSTNPRNEFLHALAAIKKSLLALQKMKAENQLPKQLQSKLAPLEGTMTLFANVSETLPSILGFEGKKRYLVLFHNNMELRPGGGFIGSYALMDVDQARITQFKVYDIYDADGKLKEHIEPPYGLRRYLGVAHLFMRDSNFNVDFTKNAENAMLFLKKETGDTVDGVVAMDTTFMKELIAVLGTVEVTEYKEKVTAENFYLLTQTHVEKDFFPGSTQKKDFLRALADEIFTAMSEKKGLSYPLLAQKIGESVQGKHLMVYMPEKSVQSIFTVNNLSGALWDGRTPSENAFLDFLGVIDANIGANKGNYYLKRSVQHNASVDDKGDMLTTTAVSYQNTSKKNSPFGGEYRNYVRFVLPLGSELQSVRLDGTSLDIVDAITDPAVFTTPGFVAPTGLEVERTIQEGKTLLGFFFTVPVESIRKVSVTYTLPEVIDTERPTFQYHLRLFKQPGAADDPYALTFTYPTAFQSVSADEGFIDVGGKMTYSSQLSHDRDISARFSRK